VVGVFQQQYSDGNSLTITGTGEQRRDFTHVSDIVSGFKALGQREWNSEIFQLGTGENYSINELATMFGGDVEYIQKRPGEAWSTLADYTEMREATGWDPQVNLEMYVRKFVES
jgi:UDP-glucose 4-epimerase